MMSSSYEHLLEEFIDKINKNQYYDAHESLELIWFPRRFEEDDEIKLIKGFINAAVSFELIKRGRIEPSKRVWQTYLKYKPLLNSIDSAYTNKYKEIITCLEEKKTDNLV